MRYLIFLLCTNLYGFSSPKTYTCPLNWTPPTELENGQPIDSPIAHYLVYEYGEFEQTRFVRETKKSYISENPCPPICEIQLQTVLKDQRVSRLSDKEICL